MEQQREKYLELAAKEQELRVQVKELEARLPALEREAAEADADAYKGELMEESGWKSRRADADRKKSVLTAAREEVRRSKEGVGILGREKSALVEVVREELLGQFKPRYGELLKNLDSTLSTAGALAQQMQATQAELDLAAGQLGIGALSLSPTGRGNIEFALAPDQLEEFRRLAKVHGYELG